MSKFRKIFFCVASILVFALAIGLMIYVSMGDHINNLSVKETLVLGILLSGWVVGSIYLIDYFRKRQY